MSNQPFYGAGASVPVSRDAAEAAITAATIAGVSAWTYRDQQRDLDKYDKALGIDLNLPKDVRKQLRDKAFRDQGEKPPTTPVRAVVYLWAVAAALLIVIFVVSQLLLELM